MKVVKDDHPDARFSISPLVAKDAEGHQVPLSEVTETLLSDDEEVVSILLDDPADMHAGAIHIGAPGLANLNYTATRNSDGAILKSNGVQITVTTGDIASVDGGDISIPDLPDA